MIDDAHDAVASVAALRAAKRTGVLAALLESADTPAAVAEETDVDERTASVLVDVLVEEGLFERVDGADEPTNRVMGLLTKTDLRSIGRLPHAIDRFECYTTLPDRLGALDADGQSNPEGQPNAHRQSSDDPARRPTPPVSGGDFAINRLGAIQATPESVVNAAVSAACRAAPAASTVLDLGGAPGPYATEFAARGYDVTLRDDPDAIDASRPLLEPRAVALDPGPLAYDHPDADLVFASDLTPRLAPDDRARTFAAACDALAARRDEAESSRAFVCVEHVRDRSPNTPVRRFDALATGDPGDCLTETVLCEQLETAGFAAVDVREIPGLDRHAVVATPRRT